MATVALLLASRQWAGWAVAEVVSMAAVGFIPVAIGIAILRYRLSAELLSVVGQTVQPTQVPLWLRPMSMKSASNHHL